MQSTRRSPRMKLIPLFLVCATVIGQFGPLDSDISSNYTVDGDTIDVVKIGYNKYFSAFVAAGEKDWKLYGMTTNTGSEDSVTSAILTLDGTETRKFVKTTELYNDLVLISWYRDTIPATLESLVYQASTGQITKPVDTLYEFAQDYDLASYHIKPVSTNTFAIAFQAVVARTRSLEPDTNGLVVVHKNGTVLIEKQYYDDEWRPFGIELFSPTFSVLSLNLSCGCVQVESFSVLGATLGAQHIFNVSGEPSNILQVRTGDKSMFIYTINNQMLALSYDLIQQVAGSEFQIISFASSSIFVHISAASLAPGVVAVSYDTLFVLRAVNARFRTLIYDLEARDQRMNDIILESNSLSGYFGVAGVDEYTHLVALFRCNESVSIGACPGHMVVSHIIFRQPSPPVGLPSLPETPVTGTVPLATQAPVASNRPPPNSATNKAAALSALSAVTVIFACFVL